MKKKLLISALAFLSFNTAVVTNVSAVCDAPTGFHVSTINNTSAVVEWTPSSGIRTYTIRYHKTDASTWDYASVDRASFTITGLYPNVNYECQVQVVCNNGWSLFTEPVKFHTLSQPITAPVAMPAASITGNSASVSWTTMPGNCGYVMQWKAASSNGWITYPGWATTPCLISGLRACSNYQYRVQTVCPSGSSSWSNVVNFITTCPTPSGGSQGHRMMNSENENTVSVSSYPNPAIDNLTIEYNSINNAEIKATVYNVLGNQVMSQVATVVEGSNQINLNVSGLSGGIYFFEIENNGELIRNKFMVTK
jgi:hypothetical protein